MALLLFFFSFQVRPVQPCHAHSAPFRPGRPTTPRRLWKGTMLAVACLSIPLVVAEEGPATVLRKTVTAQAETTTMAAATGTITRVVQLRLWLWRGITPTLIHIHSHTPIAILAPSLGPTQASTPLSSRLTLARSACLQAMVERCIAFLQTYWTSLRNRSPSIQMASTPYSTNALRVEVLSIAARAPLVFAI